MRMKDMANRSEGAISSNGGKFGRDPKHMKMTPKSEPHIGNVRPKEDTRYVHVDGQRVRFRF